MPGLVQTLSVEESRIMRGLQITERCLSLLSPLVSQVSSMMKPDVPRCFSYTLEEQLPYTHTRTHGEMTCTHIHKCTHTLGRRDQCVYPEVLIRTGHLITEGLCVKCLNVRNTAVL